MWVNLQQSIAYKVNVKFYTVVELSFNVNYFVIVMALLKKTCSQNNKVLFLYNGLCWIHKYLLKLFKVVTLNNVQKTILCLISSDLKVYVDATFYDFTWGWFKD